MAERKKVTFLTLILSHYRITVHERVRELLAQDNIEYELIYSDPIGSDVAKKDTKELPWAKKVPVKSFEMGSSPAHYQYAYNAIKESDLVIVSQENKLLMNYAMYFRFLFTGQKLAFFGHGYGHQATNPNGFFERWKKFCATKVDWWFAYTDGVGNYLKSIGYPAEKITPFRNSIDTNTLSGELESITAKELTAFRKRVEVKGKNIGLFIGGMYEEKRLEFLCEAAIKIREQVADFELLLIGSGSHAHIAQDYAEKYDFIHAPGAMFGKDIALALKASKVFLMPGLVGLAVIDSFVGECPLITTKYQYHSPEVDYLTHNVNGIMVDDDGKTETYANAVCDVFNDQTIYSKLINGCRESAELYTAENMAQNLANGMKKAVGVKDV